MIRRFWLSFLLVFVLSIALYVGAIRPDPIACAGVQPLP